MEIQKSIRSRRIRNIACLSLYDNEDDIQQFPMNCNFNMDLNGFSSVGTQTPTDDRTFEFPEVFSPTTPTMSRSSLSSSSIGTQTDVRQQMSVESPSDSSSERQSRPRPKLFRRHSTGSDVYNFSTSPTLVTAFGGAPFGFRGGLTNRMLMEESRTSRNENRHGAVLEGSQEELEIIGQQLREIGDDFDFDRVGSFRDRSATTVARRIAANANAAEQRRRTSSSSSSS